METAIKSVPYQSGYRSYVKPLRGRSAAGDFKLRRSLRSSLIAGPAGGLALRPCRERRPGECGPWGPGWGSAAAVRGPESDGLGRPGSRPVVAAQESE